MRVLVTGAEGQLGYDVIKRLNSEGIECLGTTKESLDITNRENTHTIIKGYNPDVVIHCAAYTAVDKAEDEKELCYLVNTLGTKYVAEACKAIDAKIVYISTDYVFDGEGNEPFKVTDQPNPINYYGRTKYEGELEVQNILDEYFIVRVSWVFGSNGNNFVKTMLKLSEEKDEISVVSDQVGSPTYTYDLAKLLIKIIQTDKYGIYHATNEGYCSWYEFACEIFKQSGIEMKMNPVNTVDYPTSAERPRNSRLSKEKLYEANLYTLPSYQEAISHVLSYTEREKQ